MNVGPVRADLESDGANRPARRLGHLYLPRDVFIHLDSGLPHITCPRSLPPLSRYNPWKLRVVSRSAVAQQIDRCAAAQKEVAMHADRVELSWDSAKSKWLVRIQAGDEVIRRHSALPKDADEQALRSLAQKTVQDEGYEPVPAELTIRR